MIAQAQEIPTIGLSAEIPIEIPMGFLKSPVIFTILAIIILYFAALIVLLIIREVVRNKYRKTIGFRFKVMIAVVPKEALEKEEKERGFTTQVIQEKISAAETFFSVLGGMKAQKGLKAWFFGRDDHISFEMVVKDSVITFYIAVSERMRDIVEEQIHSNYPSAQIEEVTDYNLFTPTSKIECAYLKLKRPSAFPIKTYKAFESDALSAITNSLATVKAPDSAAVQIIVRSARPAWRKFGLSIARGLQEGKSLDELVGKKRGLKTFFAPLKGLKKEEKPEKERRLSPLEEQMIKGLEEKASKAGMDVNIRVIVSAEKAIVATKHLNDIISSFNQYNIYQYGNQFVCIKPSRRKRLIENFIYRAFDERKSFVLNAEELASLFHLPGPWIETPNIRWLLARKMPAPVNVPKEGLVLGYNLFRGVETVIRIKESDRMRHIYIIGKSGVGKSELIKSMAIQDIKAGRGLCVIDPHGDLVEGLLEHIPKKRVDDVVIFDPSDTERPVGLNMLEAKTPEARDFAAQEMVAIFYKLFSAEMIGPMFEHNMRNVMLTLMSDPDNPGTVVEIPRMFTDPDYQKIWIQKVTDPVVRAFWEKEMARTSDFHKSEMLGYLISKVGRFVENEMMRNIVGQSRSGFDIRQIMNKGKILLVNLAKGKTGEVNSNLLGLIMVSKIQMAALARAEIPAEERRPFYLYIDEFQNFITDSISIILSEARKYQLGLIIAHQYMGQLTQPGPGGEVKVRDAVLGNAGTMIVFRIGIEDAEILEKEFSPSFNAYDLINSEKQTAYMKLLIDNTSSKPFPMHTYPRITGDPKIAKAVKELSRLRYGRDKATVEAEIMERARLGIEERSAGPFFEKTL